MIGTAEIIDLAEQRRLYALAARVRAIGAAREAGEITEEAWSEELRLVQLELDDLNRNRRTT